MLELNKTIYYEIEIMILILVVVLRSLYLKITLQKVTYLHGKVFYYDCYLRVLLNFTLINSKFNET